MTESSSPAGHELAELYRGEVIEQRPEEGRAEERDRYTERDVDSRSVRWKRIEAGLARMTEAELDDLRHGRG